MRRLTIVGTTPKGDGVVLSDDKGAKFLVANDPRLAAATDTSRQLEMTLQTFSPREIQARVRAGASAELIAAETGWPLDKVLRYAEPLLAERAYIAEQAQSVEVRRSGGGATLSETASAALGVEPDADAISWDALRRDDGKWVVTATFADDRGVHAAEWTYDHTGRNLHPLDDEARMLMGVRRQDDELADALGDALEIIAERPTPEPAADMRPRLVAVPDAPEEAVLDDDAVLDEEVLVEEIVVTEEIVVAEVTTAPDYAEPTITVPRQEPTPTAKKAPAKKAKARRGRASVPSWDEILFGSPKDDE